MKKDNTADIVISCGERKLYDLKRRFSSDINDALSNLYANNDFSKQLREIDESQSQRKISSVKENTVARVKNKNIVKMPTFIFLTLVF